MHTNQTITIRHSTAADTEVLRRLAELDSARFGAGPHLIAEVGGRADAAVDLVSHEVIADPFRPTAALTDLLESALAGEAAAHERAAMRPAPGRRRLLRPA